MVVSKKPNSPNINIIIDSQNIEQVTSIYVSWEPDISGWEIRKGDQEKNHDSTDHIHQHENTSIVPRHTSEYQIQSNTMLCRADTILLSRAKDNSKRTVVQTCCL